MRVKITEFKIGQPAIRALESIDIEYLDQLTGITEKELMSLHGFGKKGLAILKTALADRGLALKE